MTDTSGTPDLRAKLQELGQKLRDELSQRLDQFLDEVGAFIGDDDTPNIHPPQQ